MDFLFFHLLVLFWNPKPLSPPPAYHGFSSLASFLHGSSMASSIPWRCQGLAPRPDDRSRQLGALSRESGVNQSFGFYIASTSKTADRVGLCGGNYFDRPERRGGCPERERAMGMALSGIITIGFSSIVPSGLLSDWDEMFTYNFGPCYFSAGRTLMTTPTAHDMHTVAHIHCH